MGGYVLLRSQPRCLGACAARTLGSAYVRLGRIRLLGDDDFGGQDFTNYMPSPDTPTPSYYPTAAGPPSPDTPTPSYYPTAAGPPSPPSSSGGGSSNSGMPKIGVTTGKPGTTISIGTGSGSGVNLTTKNQPAAVSAGTNFMQSLSNTELAIGGIAGLALLLAIAG